MNVIRAAASFLNRNLHRVDEKKPLSDGFFAKRNNEAAVSDKTAGKLQRVHTYGLGCARDIAPELRNIRNTTHQLLTSMATVKGMPQNEARVSLRNLLLTFVGKTIEAHQRIQSPDQRITDSLAEAKRQLENLAPPKTVPVQSVSSLEDLALKLRAEFEEWNYVENPSSPSTEWGSCSEDESASDGDVNDHPASMPPRYTEVFGPGNHHR